jgi:hypothetical protein
MNRPVRTPWLSRALTAFGLVFVFGIVARGGTGGRVRNGPDTRMPASQA